MDGEGQRKVTNVLLVSFVPEFFFSISVAPDVPLKAQRMNSVKVVVR